MEQKTWVSDRYPTFLFHCLDCINVMDHYGTGQKAIQYNGNIVQNRGLGQFEFGDLRGLGKKVKR